MSSTGYMNIMDEIGISAMLGQLMEECAELIVAASKIQRIVDTINPPRCTMEEAMKNFTEECTDVDNCLTWLEQAGLVRFDVNVFVEKNQRWEKAIRSTGFDSYDEKQESGLLEEG